MNSSVVYLIQSEFAQEFFAIRSSNYFGSLSDILLLEGDVTWIGCENLIQVFIRAKALLAGQFQLTD